MVGLRLSPAPVINLRKNIPASMKTRDLPAHPTSPFAGGYRFGMQPVGAKQAQDVPVADCKAVGNDLSCGSSGAAIAYCFASGGKERKIVSTVNVSLRVRWNRALKF